MSDARALSWFSIVRLGLVQTALGAIVVLTTIADYRPAHLPHDDAETACLNRYVRQVAATRPDVVVVDLAWWVCPRHRCRTTVAGRRLRTDGLHFADDTSEIVLLWVLRQALGPWGGP